MQGQLRQTRDMENIDPGSASGAVCMMRVGSGIVGFSIAAHYDARLPSACYQSLMTSSMSLRTCPVSYFTSLDQATSPPPPPPPFPPRPARPPLALLSTSASGPKDVTTHRRMQQGNDAHSLVRSAQPKRAMRTSTACNSQSDGVWSTHAACR